VGGEKQCPFRFEGDRPLEWMVCAMSKMKILCMDKKGVVMVCAMSKMTIYIWTKREGGGFVYKI
jgi:hypothetical protein